jgi:hypothetical protein
MTEKTVQQFMDASRKYWELLPPDYRAELQTFIEALRNDFSPMFFIKEVIPKSWSENKELINAFSDYLRHLATDKGIKVTKSRAKAMANMIFLKTKDNTDKAIEAFLYSTARGYATPYVVERQPGTQNLSIGLPTPGQIKTIFSTFYPKQPINDKFIQFFQDFNQWLMDNPLHNALYGKNLEVFAKELSKLTEQSLGKTFTCIKYLTALDTTILPTEYAVVLNWAQNHR